MNNVAFQIYGSKKTGIFQSTWDTTKTSTGSSATNQITLPLISGGTYNFWIDWGDGSTTNVTSYSQIYSGETLPRTHTYTTAGIYTVRITGVCTGWYFNNTGDRLKILSISSWGILKLGTVGGGCFYGCANLNLSSVTDVLNLTGTTQLSSCFRLCTTLTTVNRMNEWDLSTVTRIDGMFLDATNFNQNIGNWNVSAVTNMGSVFANCILFNQNLGSWNTISVTSMSNMFQKASVFNNGLAPGVTGTMNWNTSNVITMASMFINALAFNQDINSWNVSGVTNMSTMFYQASAFNQPLTNWESTGSTLANVVNMQSMFYGATAFNQPIGNWNVSGVTTMLQMFNFTTAFNQDISSWNVGKVTTFAGMFWAATAFNNGDNSDNNSVTGLPGINGWPINTTATSVDMGAVFYEARAFNRPIENWNMTKVISLSLFLRGARMFNQSLSNWERGDSTLANVTGMTSMFYDARVFNQNINNWNVSKVTTMNGMFFNTPAFNEPLNNWNTSAVINMTNMFDSGSSLICGFNQDIGSWNVSNVTNFTRFMFTKTPATFSSTNLDAIYNGWSTQTLQHTTPITISFGTAKYSSAGTAGRLTLTSSPNNWAITDGGQLP